LRRTTRLVLATAAILIVYLGIMVQNGPRNGVERFPFFRWELFSRIPTRERESYSIRLTEVNGKALKAPVYFEDADGLVAERRSPSAYQTLQQLGRFTDAKDEMRAAFARQVLETRFMPEITEGRYEVVRRRFDILERLECSCFITETVIGEQSIG